jgi:hypothetical protein
MLGEAEARCPTSFFNLPHLSLNSSVASASTTHHPAGLSSSAKLFLD